MALFTIHASKVGDWVETQDTSPTLTVAKANTLHETGWDVHVTDSDGRRYARSAIANLSCGARRPAAVPQCDHLDQRLFARKVIYTAFLRPKRDIAAPVTPRYAPCSSGGQEDHPSCHCKVFGNRAPGLSASDHQNRPGGKRVWTAVARRVDLQHARRKRLRHLRSARAVQAAAGDNHGARRELAGRRDEA